MNTQDQIRNLYLGAVELKKLTGWPDIIIELIMNFAENQIVISDATDSNDINKSIYPVESEDRMELDFPQFQQQDQKSFDIIPIPEAELSSAEIHPVRAYGSMADQDSDRVEIIGGSIAGSHLSSDLSPGINASITTADLVGKTIIVKNGIITSFS